MPTVTINIAGRGTNVSDDGTGNPGQSSVGHMWYELNNSQGQSESYGFAPVEHGDPFGPGKRYDNDSSNYQSRDYSRTIEITQAQYDAMKNFGDNPAANGFTDYNGINNSCIDFTWKALEVGGLNPSGYEGSI